MSSEKKLPHQQSMKIGILKVSLVLKADFNFNFQPLKLEVKKIGLIICRYRN